MCGLGRKHTVRQCSARDVICRVMLPRLAICRADAPTACNIAKCSSRKNTEIFSAGTVLALAGTEGGSICPPWSAHDHRNGSRWPLQTVPQLGGVSADLATGEVRYTHVDNSLENGVRPVVTCSRAGELGSGALADYMVASSREQKKTLKVVFLWSGDRLLKYARSRTE